MKEDSGTKSVMMKNKYENNPSAPNFNKGGHGRFMEGVFFLKGKDFTNAGAASSEFKAILERIGTDQNIIRRAAIAAFEAEMNVIIYTPAGMMHYEITPNYIKVICEDMGPGIEDIELAMQEGYSTAPDYIREMGFGSGMGLPNIKKNTDEVKITSSPGAGTTLEFVINIKGDAT